MKVNKNEVITYSCHNKGHPRMVKKYIYKIGRFVIRFIKETQINNLELNFNLGISYA